MSARRLLAFALLAHVACDDAGSLGDPIEDFKTSEGVDFKECGFLEFTDASCPAEEQEALECLTTAFSACSAAHLQQVFYTTEGARIVEDFFVVTRTEGCTTVHFTDNREDTFGTQEISREDCREVSSEANDQCTFAAVDNCVSK